MSEPPDVDEELRVRFVMDEAWHRAFHAEMVDVRLVRWRLQRRLSWSAVVLGAGQVVIATLLWMPVGLGVGALFAALGMGSLLRQHRRRERWLQAQRELPSFGATLGYHFENGMLIQTAETTGEVLGIPRGHVTESPEGWFVRYQTAHLGSWPTDDVVRTADASIWLPHAAVDPPTTRDAFAQRLSEVFEVRRWT